MPDKVEKIISNSCYYLQFIIGGKKAMKLAMHLGACVGYLNRKEYINAITTLLPFYE